MANEWFVQHGGKEHGPLSSATLKKLAGENKITQATKVRLGADGAWVPASRVQGLFAAQAASANPMPPAKPQAPKAVAPPAARPAVKPRPAAPPEDELDPLLDALPPPRATAAPRMPIAAAVPLPKALPVPSDGGSVAGKILGAIALIFGLVALATFWLPILDKGPVAWIGIVVGGLGLLLGGTALALSALKGGTGLALPIAGTGSSVVGLVLTSVLGFVLGMFSPTPPPMVVSKPVVESPPQLPPVAPPKQPEPPPEPEWFDAHQGIQQGDIKAGISVVGIEQIRIEDVTTFKKPKPQPMLKVKVVLENTSTDKIVEFPGWVGGMDLAGQGLGEVLGNTDAGKALAKVAGAGAILIDNAGNKYKQTPAALQFGGVNLNQDNSLRPGQSAEKELLFAPPLVTIEYLRLELPPGGFGGSDSLRFQIPRDMVEGLPPLPEPTEAKPAETR